jgi:perosamine synthetase
MIEINKPFIGEEERREVLSVMEEKSLTSSSREGGKRVRDFEQLLRAYLKVKHAVAVNSGTAALHAAFIASEIKNGEVLLPSFTFVATANAVIAAGGKPIFVDINKEDYTINLSDLKSKITNKTKGIIPVHLYGNPAEMDEIIEVAHKYSIDIIEDACQSLGSTFNNRQTGTMGLMGCFSMYASKVVTSGEGGAVVTDNDEMAAKLSMIRNHGMLEGYDTRIFGLNLRLPELNAAIAKVQMTKLAKILELRKRNAELLSEMLLSIPGIKNGKVSIPNELAIPDDIYNENRGNQDTRIYKKKQSNWYLYTIAFKKDGIRDSIKQKMIADKIGVTVYYDPPVHKTPYYEKLASIRTANRITTADTSFTSSNANNNNNNNNSISLNNTEWASKHVLSLPVHPSLTSQDIEYIATSLGKAM